MTALHLSTLKSTTLKRIAFLIGHNNSGTKADLLNTLPTAICTPRLPLGRQRILSIDMGIRNLAYCVIDVETELGKGSKSHGDQTGKGEVTVDFEEIPTEVDRKRLLNSLNVVAWRRTAISSLSSIPFPTPDSRTTSPTPDKTQKESFAPSVFATLAYQLLATTLLPHQPTHILIERQRWRSGGAPAVLEWTVRVNIFESMLHAVLETLREQWKIRSGGSIQGAVGEVQVEESVKVKAGDVLARFTNSFPEVHSVSPKKVARFWTEILDDAAVTTTATTNHPDDDDSTPSPTSPKKQSPSKVEKESKIAIAETWLRNGSLTFSGPAAQTRAAFLAKRVKSNRRKGKNGGKTAAKGDGEDEDLPELEGEQLEDTNDIGKLDDLADCLLQGVAWAQWEANRRCILDTLDNSATGTATTATTTRTKKSKVPSDGE